MSFNDQNNDDIVDEDALIRQLEEEFE